MENANKKGSDIIDLGMIAQTIMKNKRKFIKPLVITFVLSCIYIFSLPRYYKSEVSLAPELGFNMSSNPLGSLATSFGFDLDQMQTTDAITPMLYPDLMDDNGFVASLANIRVVSKTGNIDATYHDYLKLHQKSAWWSYVMNWLKGFFPKTTAEEESVKEYDPYDLPMAENDLLDVIRGNVKIGSDKKTGVISILIQSQDPHVCRILGDSIQQRLQVYITQYRTNKARIDCDYYHALTDSAKRAYDTTRRQYALLSDANTNVSLKSVSLRLEDLENEMALKFTTYSTLNTQLQMARAKVQERTPAFTVIKGAAVPVRPAGPKRMIFVAGMLLFVSLLTALWLTRNIIIGRKTPNG